MIESKIIICFFQFQNEIQSFSIVVDSLNNNGEAEAIQKLCLDKNINFYSLSFVVDNNKITYKAEYLHSRDDFQSRNQFIPVR